MSTELVQIAFHKIMQTRAYTVIILGTDDKHFAIYTEPSIGRIIQMSLTDTPKPRPYTHDLMDMIFEGMNIRIKQIVITDIQDTVYFARLFLEQRMNDDTRHIVEVDARPSDCIALALSNGVPVYCTRDVLERAVPVED